LRIVNLLFALVLLVALVIALDPQARRRAVETVQSWQPALKQLDSRVVVNVPSVSTPGTTSTPIPTPTSVADADHDEQIPVTGDNNASNEPIIQINWDALGNALRQFWVSLSQVKIEFNPPKDNK
jgi:hypothetical protein